MARSAAGIVELPALGTVHGYFNLSHSRLDIELVVDIVLALGAGPERAVTWRQACRAVLDMVGAASVVTVFSRLPADLPEFAGRQAELEQVVELTDSADTPTAAMVCAITGMAGVGKTQLAIHVGHELCRRGRFTELQLVVDLRGCDVDAPPADPMAVLDAFLRCLGVPGSRIHHLDLAARSDRFRQLMAGRRALILLDNALNEDQVRPLLPGDSSCLVLITARRSLTHLPMARHWPLDVFTFDEALDLLRCVAGADRIDTDMKAVSGIAKAVGYLPLALGLVASRIRASSDWTLSDHLARLVEQQQHMRLDDGIEVALGLSYNDLSPGLRRTFRLLVLSPGNDLDLYAAAALAGVDMPTMRQQLLELLAANLLLQNATGRYGFHDLVRIYGKSRGQDEDPRAIRRGALTRLFDYYRCAAAGAMEIFAPHERRRRLQMPAAETCIPALGDAESAARWLDAERANLLALALYGSDNGWAPYTVQLSDVLHRYLDVAAHYHDAEILHVRASQVAEPAERARALINLGVVRLRLGRYPAALDDLRESLPLFRQCGDIEGVGRALANLGIIYERLGSYRSSIRHHRQALAIFRRVGDRDGECRTLDNLGTVLDRLGRYAEADRHLRQALAVFREIGDQVGEGRALNNLGRVFEHMKSYEKALDYHRRALATARRAGDRAGEGMALGNLGETFARLGRSQLALDHHRRALALARKIGNRQSEVEALNSMGVAFRLEGSPAKALRYHREALALAIELSHRRDQAEAYDGIAHSNAELGDADSARSHWRLALDIYAELGTPEAVEVEARLEGPPG